MAGGGGGSSGRLATFQRVMASRSLRRMELSYLGFAACEQLTWLASIIYAYNRGGPAEAGLAAALLLIPAVVIAPIAGVLGDRLRPHTALALGYGTQATMMAATAAALWADQPVLVYIAAGATAASITSTRPVVGSMLAVVARSPHELVAANVVTTMVEQAGSCLGPTVGGVLLAVASPAAAFATSAAVLTASCALALTLPSAPAAPRRSEVTVVGEIRHGLGALRSDKGLFWLVALVGVAALCVGVIDVMGITFAAGRLEAGEAVAGLLAAAFGVGALIGSGFATGLVGGARMSPYLAGGAVLIGAPVMALAAINSVTLGVVLFVLAGTGQAIVLIIAHVAIQRRAPANAVSRVLGVVEGVAMLSIAAGSLLFARLAAAFDLTQAVVVVGVVLMALVTALALRLVLLHALDAPPAAELFERIVADKLFAPLPVAALERLAAVCEPVNFADGETIIVQGEPGEFYFLIQSGMVTVTVDGIQARSMTAGGSFGEIALLNDQPRTATVTAAEPTAVLRVSRESFLAALSANSMSSDAASDMAAHYAMQDALRKAAS